MDVFLIFVFVLALIGFAAKVFVAAFLETDTDEWYHLYLAREVKKEAGIPATENRFKTNFEFAYPPLLHIILAFFVDRLPVKAIKVLYLVFDILVALTIFFAGSFLQLDAQSTALASLLYLVTAINLSEGTFLNARSMGLFFYTIVLASVLLFIKFYDFTWAAVGLFAFAALCLTHRMALQTMLLSIIASSAYLFATDFAFTAALHMVAMIPAAFAIAMILSRGVYLRVLQEHARLVAAHATEKWRLLNPVKILAFVPWLVLAPWLLSFGVPTPLVFVLHSFVFAPLFLAVFWPWGDGTRHAYYATPALLLIFASAPYAQFNALVVGVLATASLAIGLALLKNCASQRIGAELKKCFAFFNTHAGTVLGLPAYPCSALWFTKNLLANGSNMSKGFLLYKKLLEGKKNQEIIEKHIKQYGVKWVWTSGTEFDDSLKKIGLKPVFEKGEFKVYK